MATFFDDKDVPSETQRDRVLTRELPFVQFPIAILREYGQQLGACGIAVYAAIKSYAGWDDDECFILVKTIAAQLSMGESTVRREITKLCDLKLIERQLRTGKSSIFVLSDISYLIAGTPLPNSGSPLLGRGSPLLGRDITRTTKQESLNISPSEGISAKDQRFKNFVEALNAYWKFKNSDIPFSFGSADGKNLKVFLRDNPRLDETQFKTLLRNRANSVGVVHTDPVRKWISSAMQYAGGALDRFGKTPSNEVAPSQPRLRSAKDTLRDQGIEI